MYLLSVTEIVACKYEGKRDSKNQGHQRQHCGEGHSTGRLLAPNEKVEQEASAKKHKRIKDGRQKRGSLPLGSSECLIETSSIIASNQSLKSNVCF